jgi:predicted CXXCH cytochrome family protein
MIPKWLAASVCASALLFGCERASPPAAQAPPAPAPVAVADPFDASTCADCHPEQYAAWRGSQHARAMFPLETAPPHFDGQWLEHGDEAVRFSTDAGSAFFEVRGVAGSLPVRHAFGVMPLQQYLIDIGGGRLQASTWAWDTRPASAGGQRWFFVYPDDANRRGTRLHWAGPQQNWNHQCAHCHATGFDKAYVATGDRFNTRYAEAGVSCAACHGDAGAHLAWAKQDAAARQPLAHAGFATSTPATSAVFEFGAGAIAQRRDGAGASADVDACGACHARAAPLPGSASTDLADSHRLALLEEGLYFADGRMDDEVFNLGSFYQSRMYSAGVGCGHCHEPHGGGLRAPGDALCAQCHRPDVFDSSAHRGHAGEGAGSACVDCHMPQRTYMVIDARHDHSFQRPDPAEAARVGAPDACGGCHADRATAWKTRAIAGWRRPDANPQLAYADALLAGRRHAIDAHQRLLAIVDDPEHAGIVRASAWMLLARQPGAGAWQRTSAAAADADPLVRMAVARFLEQRAADGAEAALAGLLSDSRRSVRFEAVRALLRRPDLQALPAFADAYRLALAEYRDSLLQDQDRAAARVALAGVELARGQPQVALNHIRRATTLDPSEVVAWVNRIEIERALVGEAAATAVLAEGIGQHPDSAELWHVRGLHAVRARHADEALAALEKAAELAADEPRFVYVLGVAQHDLVDAARGRRTLEHALERFPGYAPIAQALLAWAAAAGDVTAAQAHEQRLRELQQ